MHYLHNTQKYMDRKTLLSALKLDYYTASPLPEQTLDVIFQNKSQLLGKENGQEKCEELKFPFARSPVKNLPIANSNILLQPTVDSVYTKEIVEITLDCEEFKEYIWQPGDTIAILPSNKNEDVFQLLKLLELEGKADKICSVVTSPSCTKKNVKTPAYIPTSTTPREILRDCLNLKSILSKKILRSLAEYCTDNQEKHILKCLSSKEGSSVYNDFVIKGILSLIDILKICSTCKPPFSLIIEHLARLLPRPYSIANSPLNTNSKITFIFSILETNPGVTTNMLKEIILNESLTLKAYLREINYFRYTDKNYQENQILIAVGTGLAPYLGFLEHKQHMMDKNEKNPGITWLFLGTPTQTSVIHREKLIEWHSRKILNYFVESYSRTPTAPFHSVHQALLGNAQKLVELLVKPDTYLYLCADGGHISKSIEETLQVVLATILLISDTESMELVKKFKTNKKIREDIWQ